MKLKFWLLFLVNLLLVGLIIVNLNFLKNLQNKTDDTQPKSQPTTFKVANPADKVEISLTLVGDIMLGRTINFKSHANKNGFWPFENINYLTQRSDISFGNLEGPIFSQCPLTNSGMKLCGLPLMAEGLSKAGFDIVSLANNHLEDFGQKGLTETEQILNHKDILSVGIKNPVYKTIKDIKLGFLAYNFVGPHKNILPQPNQTEIIQKLKESDSSVDWLVVSLHWGQEYTAQPGQEQVDLAHQLIDNGADLIVGHHPHWIQPVETYQDKLIFYSLGNFVFDQMWSEKTRQGLLVNLNLSKNRVLDYEIIPVWIENYGQPKPMSGQEKEKILNTINL